MAKLGGRQIEVGVGIESSAGTPVAATDWFKWDSFTYQSMSDKELLNSARGIRNKTSNSIVMKKYGKGDIEFVPTVDIMPYALSLFMGTRNSATHSGESAVYDHTYTIQNANASMKTATLLVVQGGVQTERYANVVADSLDLTVDKSFAKCKLGLIGNFPDTSSGSSSYTQDTLFSRNNLNATFGASLSAAAGTAATTTLTSDATAPANNSTVTVGTTVYTYKTALSSPAVPYEVLIGASASAALDNLKAAINGASGGGSTYGLGTVPHALVIATTKTSTTLLIQAIIPGTAANTIATLASSSPNSHDTWAGATMNSGTPGTAPSPTLLTQFSLTASNNVLFEEAFLSGSNQPVAGGFVAGPLTIKGSYTIQFADTAELAKYQLNTNSAMIVNIVGAPIGVVASEELIQIKLGRLVLTKAPLEYQLDGLTLLKQEFEVQYDATDKEMAIVVTNTNSGSNY